MEKLKIVVDGREKTIEAERFAKGIYTVDDPKTVKRNIEKLSITLGKNENDAVLQNRVTKIGKWSFLTSKAANSYLQFIFMPSAETEDLERLLEGRDAQYRQLLTNTYNLSKLEGNNLDVLNELDKMKN